MPIRKPRLSRAEKATYLDRLLQVRDEGIDVEIPEEWLEAARVLEIGVGPPWENMIFNVQHDGVAYYAVWVRLVALRSHVIVPDCEIRTAFDNHITVLPLDPRNQVFKLGWFEFERREILDVAGKNLRFWYRGQIVEGWLLASGAAPIPAEYPDFAMVPFEIVLTDQFGHESHADGRLSVARKSRLDNAGVSRGTGLNGLDATGKPRELSPSEESRLRYRELVAQKANRRKPTTDVD
jgi:hypothetical protein